MLIIPGWHESFINVPAHLNAFTPAGACSSPRMRDLGKLCRGAVRRLRLPPGRHPSQEVTLKTQPTHTEATFRTSSVLMRMNNRSREKQLNFVSMIERHQPR